MLLMVMGQVWATHRLRERNCYWGMGWRNTVMLLCISERERGNEMGRKRPDRARYFGWRVSATKYWTNLYA